MTDFKASKRLIGTSSERTAVTPSSDPVADTSTSSGNTILKFTAVGSYLSLIHISEPTRPY